LAPDRKVAISGDRALSRVRTRLTLWYAGTFTVILLLLGLGLFLTVRTQLSRALDDSLSAATLELTRVAGSREFENEPGDSALLDAVDELRIPERTLYLLDVNGAPLVPTEADDWIRAAAIEAAAKGQSVARHDTPDGRTLRMEARRFRTARGRPLVALAIADQYELEDRYTALIGAFTAAALLAILLVAAGGWILAQQSTAPIETGFANMRRFMADAAHQLKTPVAILRANADVALQQQRDAESYRAVLESVDAEAQRMGTMVDRLLMLARADAGVSVTEKRRIFLDDIASDCIVAARPMADLKHVTLDMQAFEEAAIQGDPSLIRELIVILLDNAIKYSREGGTVTVRAEMKEHHAVLTVSDVGIGIQPRDLPRVFDRFYRGERGRADRDGAGLGLSIARWIAAEHSATLAIQSEPDVGTIATVTFPPVSAKSAIL
jgi:signal transduction histidine kinase